MNTYITEEKAEAFNDPNERILYVNFSKTVCVINMNIKLCKTTLTDREEKD